MIRGLPGPEYVIHAEFRAPLPFAYRWCTDYSPVDSKLEGEPYIRRVLSRSRKQIVYEDLEDAGRAGWNWQRVTVELQPPDAWRMESHGNHRYVRAEYKLTRLGPDRTGFELRYRRREGPLPSGSKMTKAQREASVTAMWKRFSTALNRDYRKSKRTR